MGTAAYGGKGFKGRAVASGERPMGAASCRQQHSQVTCQSPSPNPRGVIWEFLFDTSGQAIHFTGCRGWCLPSQLGPVASGASQNYTPSPHTLPPRTDLDQEHQIVQETWHWTPVVLHSTQLASVEHTTRPPVICLCEGLWHVIPMFPRLCMRVRVSLLQCGCDGCHNTSTVVEASHAVMTGRSCRCWCSRAHVSRSLGAVRSCTYGGATGARVSGRRTGGIMNTGNRPF